MAVPLLPAGAIFDTNDGSVASSRLKARKNRKSAATTPVKSLSRTAMAKRESPSRATAPQKMGFMRPYFSATTMAGTTATKDTAITGR